MNEVKYSNAVDVQVQFFELQLKFRLQGEEGIVDSTTIILSPQHMKVLSDVLAEAVVKYEKEFGEIGMPQADAAKEEE